MGQVLIGISQLVTNCEDPNDPSAPLTSIGELGIVEDAAVIVDDDRCIVWVGPERELPSAPIDRTGFAVHDLGGRAVTPGFVDSHTHLVFAGDRCHEFEMRMAGTPYDGGGIMETVRATRATSADELEKRTGALVREARSQGTTTIEIKSGYGLTTEDELKLLHVAARFTPEVTFLGPHVVPEEWRGDRQGYVDLVCGKMLDAVAADGCARWADVFCEPHSPVAFDGLETERYLKACRARGIPVRLHGAQLGYGPGPRLACEYDAASVDHCTFLSDDDLEALAATWSQPGGGGTVATFLPLVEFSTRQPYPDMSRPLRAGAVVSIATDCNPGTCASSSMPLTMAIAVRDMGLTPAQALWAATAGGAIALRRDDIGAVRAGSRADFAVIDAPDFVHLMYRPGVPLARALDL